MEKKTDGSEFALVSLTCCNNDVKTKFSREWVDYFKSLTFCDIIFKFDFYYNDRRRYLAIY